MPMRQVAGLVVVLALCSSTAWALPCASACKDEIASCATQYCPGLHGLKLQHCKRVRCKKPIVQKCYLNLSVCGATSAKPGAGGPPASPGGW